MSNGLRLNKNQQIAAEYKDQHILVLAGAGTGKTLTIIARAEYLIRKGVDPRRILLLTFTRRAAREMTDRLYLGIGDAANVVTAGTFHHFCLLTMRRMADKFGIQDFTVIDRDDQNSLMRLVRTGYVTKGEKFPRASQLVNIFSYSRNTNMSVLEYLNKYTDFAEETCNKILAVFAEYKQRKQLNRYLDFDDILYHFGKKLHEDSSIRNRLRSRYDHILVDETQDTNPLQWIILDGMKDPAKLFCVGDDAQSIYAFRGADFRNVHSFKKRIPDSVILKLEDNYRSTQEILDISNWLLKESPLKYNKKLKAQRGTGIKPVLVDFDSDLYEAKWVAEDLIERHETGSLWSDHMILTRTAWGSRSVEAMLIEKNIPYIFIGGISFLQAAHVKDLLCLIRASASNHDELAWIRYLTLWPRIGDVTASRLISAMKEMGTMNEALEQLSNKLKKDQQKIVDGPKTILKYWNEPTKALRVGGEFLKPILSEKYDKWDLRNKDFDLLVRLAERYRSLMRFIETYTLDPITSTVASRLDNQDVVTLITVHSAKGTESPVCYVIRVEPGMYPHIRSLGAEDDEEEERRILYVAMTRAKNELILTRSEGPSSYSYSYGDAAEAYFLSDVPDKLVEEHWQYEMYLEKDDDFLT
ncbi:MAG: ATP-dependent helicase [Deltaproteobacteria bacterium]|nr:ATP-dependent helicase [Deltaproteobacteria bacterium]MBW2089234.1 ATP-dependent helicase [Deltaproteobacteria bacterium]